MSVMETRGGRELGLLCLGGGPCARTKAGLTRLMTQRSHVLLQFEGSGDKARAIMFSALLEHFAWGDRLNQVIT